MRASPSSPRRRPPGMRLSARERRRRTRSGLLVTIAAVLAAVLLGLAVRAIHDALSPTPSPFASRPTVVRVIDGDTIDVRVGRSTTRIRLLGIDTPETKDPRRPVQCFGAEASRRTSELLPVGTVVRLEPDRETHDAFGRTLAYVHRDDGLFVNLTLVAEGYAVVLTIAPNGAHAAEFEAAETAARSAPNGLWRACGGPGHPARSSTDSGGR